MGHAALHAHEARRLMCPSIRAANPPNPTPQPAPRKLPSGEKVVLSNMFLRCRTPTYIPLLCDVTSRVTLFSLTYPWFTPPHICFQGVLGDRGR